jgi:hypothetical protein
MRDNIGGHKNVLCDDYRTQHGYSGGQKEIIFVGFIQR